ncbi:hypothetical protein [uncultured Paraglaciecola sp.]|uniref:hypothetical protein n=1 Tax=uncultured Paraglaciecola sp. TaxID=1765024 RepID=UPI00261291D9|nr:hypothetical protein [uncultured Paraglaciecola sp.]
MVKGDENKLLIIVGEIRSDIKHILDSEKDQTARMEKLEERQRHLEAQIATSKGRQTALVVMIPLVISIVGFLMTHFATK